MYSISNLLCVCAYVCVRARVFSYTRARVSTHLCMYVCVCASLQCDIFGSGIRCLAMQYCDRGDLLSFLHAIRSGRDVNAYTNILKPRATMEHMSDIVLGIANGMEYVSTKRVCPTDVHDNMIRLAKASMCLYQYTWHCSTVADIFVISKSIY
jgi:hypothetical protein